MVNQDAVDNKIKNPEGELEKHKKRSLKTTY